jgi:radical SAM family uncharacterized protein
MQDVDFILSKVTRPARYAGGEWNAIVKDWDSTPLRLALAYPDVYDIGMSNMGLAILYDILNAQPDVLAERVFAPWPDMEKELRAQSLPLFSLENRRSLAEFDAIGFSLGYELTYTNVLNMLDLAGLPLHAAERTSAHPLVLAGGTAALNPEPLAAFVDAFVLGDGEEPVLEIAEALRQATAQATPRRQLLRELARIDGVYVPSLYNVDYNDDGTVKEVRPLDGAPAKVRRRFLERLSPSPVRPIVPFMQTVHDRAAIEIQRGCVRGCRFCQAGIVYRPRRERTSTEVLDTARAILDGSGYDELGLLSLSTADHSEIIPIVEALRREFGEGLAVALPSLRVDSFSVRLAAAAAGPGRRNITFAPEAGSQRLRNVINKPTTDDDLLQAAEAAFGHGWTKVKLYFMVGLPTETLEDIQGIIELAGAVKDAGRRQHGGRAQVKVSTSIFVPKPHTPFQWAAQPAEAEINARHEHLRRGLKRLGIAFSWNDPRQTMLEAMLSRGDRRLSAVIERAWRLGARFDAWNELLDLAAWRTALAEEGLDAAFYARRARDEFETLPWSHLDSGVSEAFLRGEWRKALAEETTPECRVGPCNVCGLQAYSEACAERLAELPRVEKR